MKPAFPRPPPRLSALLPSLLVAASLLPRFSVAPPQFPAFQGPTPGVLREVSIPTVDLSGDTHRQVVIARGTPTEYHGHCDTVLMADGRTLVAAWCMNHAGYLGPLSRSDDGGRTWSAPLPTPANWKEVTRTTPVMHRLTDPQGVERLFVFAGCDFRARTQREPRHVHRRQHRAGHAASR